MVLLLAFGNGILEGWHLLCANFPALLNKKMFFPLISSIIYSVVKWQL
jgi:hypothetical protein